MTPQSNVVIVAPIRPEGLSDLRQLLLGMNARPGEADPHNRLVPFAQLDTLHFARFVILDDQTIADFEVYGLPKPSYPIYLLFLAEFDGDRETFMQRLCKSAQEGLRQIFSHCTGFTADVDLIQWLGEREVCPSTYYFAWRGGTMRQVRQEEQLREAIIDYLQSSPELSGLPASQIHRALRQYVVKRIADGTIPLTPDSPTPLSWKLRNIADLIAVPLTLLLAFPLLLIYAPLYLFQLRRRENRDPVITPKPDPDSVRRLAAIEDYGRTNQFSAMGSLKPGTFRRWTGVLVLCIINYSTRHIFNRGRLARVLSIHSASWTFIDDRRRLFFASHYDGSLESYMDDFVNKVAFGLNVTFSNGMGYPKTRWLLMDGAKDEQSFKYFIRRHQLPTEVWYNGHACLTNANLERNRRIRKGIETKVMTDDEARRWFALF